jgi:hypothetical protein
MEKSTKIIVQKYYAITCKNKTISNCKTKSEADQGIKDLVGVLDGAKIEKRFYYVHEPELQIESFFQDKILGHCYDDDGNIVIAIAKQNHDLQDSASIVLFRNGGYYMDVHKFEGESFNRIDDMKFRLLLSGYGDSNWSFLKNNTNHELSILQVA